jgi:hypothetical protein
MLVFGFLYSPAYPLGTRLGITVFWQPAVIQDLFLKSLTRRCLVISQWLILWFYTQRIYFASLDIINTTSKSNTMLVSLAYLGVTRSLWRKKRRKFIRRRKKPLKPKIRWILGHIQRNPRVQFVRNTSILFPLKTIHRTQVDLCWSFTGLLRSRTNNRIFRKSGGLNKFGNYFFRYTYKLANMHTDLIKRFLKGFYKTVVIKNYKNYLGPKQKVKRKFTVIKQKLTRNTRFTFSIPFDLEWYRHMWLIKFLAKRRQFLGRHLYRRFRRKSSVCRARVAHLRFFWYIKLCFETYFKQRIALNCINLYLSYFQPGAISRLSLRDSTALNRYITGLKKRRQAKITKFRRLARDLSFRPGKPTTINKFSYTQIVLFLGLHPGWRKLVNVYTLCYIVIVSALLKNVQMLSQWLYNMVSLGQTRRFRLMRMRFFMLVAKLLRDYAVFGQYLKGFRIEVYGKTGRSQKTRTRFFGDTTGLRFYRLSFRMNYQAFDIPTFAGVLGVRFWLY